MKSGIPTDILMSLLSFLMMAKQRIIAIGSTHGLTAMQSMTLIILDNNQPRPMNALALTFGCDASNVTGIIDGLEQKGLIYRTESRTDRRKKVILLTEAGLEHRRAIVAEMLGSNGSCLDTLDPTELEQLKAILAKLTVSCPGKRQAD